MTGGTAAANGAAGAPPRAHGLSTAGGVAAVTGIGTGTGACTGTGAGTATGRGAGTSIGIAAASGVTSTVSPLFGGGGVVGGAGAGAPGWRNGSPPAAAGPRGAVGGVMVKGSVGLWARRRPSGMVTVLRIVWVASLAAEIAAAIRSRSSHDSGRPGLSSASRTRTAGPGGSRGICPRHVSVQIARSVSIQSVSQRMGTLRGPPAPRSTKVRGYTPGSRVTSSACWTLRL